MMKVNLENYPAIKELSKEDKDAFLKMFKGIFNTMELMISKGFHKDSERYFKMPLHELAEQLLLAMFDHRGILDSLPRQGNADTISETQGHMVNPLYSAFSGTELYDKAFNEVSFEEKFGLKKEEFTVKTWLQGLMFLSYYGSMEDIGKYLAADEYDLFEEEKHKNIAKLVEVQPALNYQKSLGYLAGRLIPGTGYFKAGMISSDTKTCPACKMPDTLEQVTRGVKGCRNCKAGFTV